MEIINEYDKLYTLFNGFTMSELLDLCEKHQLSIYGNREMVVDRLSYHFSEGRRKYTIQYRLKQCYLSIIKSFYGDYTEI